jgi:aquaporin Z
LKSPRIGFTVLAGAVAVGSLSHAVFNPAVAGGMTLLRIVPVQDIWIYLVGNFLGGALAGVVFNFLNPDDK